MIAKRKHDGIWQEEWFDEYHYQENTPGIARVCLGGRWYNFLNENKTDFISTKWYTEAWDYHLHARGLAAVRDVTDDGEEIALFNLIDLNGTALIDGWHMDDECELAREIYHQEPIDVMKWL